MTGNIGREGTGINPMRGQNNIQGAGDAGRAAQQLPRLPAGHRPGQPGQVRGGLGRRGRAREGHHQGARARAVRREDLRDADLRREHGRLRPDRAHCEHALKSLEHLVVIDMFLTETAELADVVLPGRRLGRGRRRVHQHRAPPAARARRPCRPRARPSPTGGSSGRSPSASGAPGFEWSLAKDVFNELCEPVGRPTTASTGTWSPRGATTGPCPRRGTPARRSCTSASSRAAAACS